MPAFRQLFRNVDGDFTAFYKATESLSGQSYENRQKVLAQLGQDFHEDL